MAAHSRPRNWVTGEAQMAGIEGLSRWRRTLPVLMADIKQAADVR
jgi:hypothetical protein